jgi:1-aminocyclopropane-1-carboxylate deaminase/D-cysteine desulfhydrase-like pyridoxal-dependent ACC family enzyme
MIKLDYNLVRLENNCYLLDENRNNSFISGNKVRKLKGIISNVENPQGLLTFGSVYSSHCLATSYYGKLFEIPVVLIILTDDKVSVKEYPHLAMSKHLGASLLFCSTDSAHEFIKEKKQEFQNNYWIPGGGHTIQAAKEYEKLFSTLFKKNKELSERINNVVLPYGTGTTSLGIYNGLNSAGFSHVKVTGISVSRDEERCRRALIDLEPNTDYSNLDIIDDYAGKYEGRTEATEKARIKFLKESGVLVDPIYNAKSVECFYRYKMENTLVVNTGGMLNNLL